MDGWYCNGCKSLNRPRAGRCYSCGAKPEAAPIAVTPPPTWGAGTSSAIITADPSTMSAWASGPVRVRRRYLASNLLGWTLVILIAACCVTTALLATFISSGPSDPIALLQRLNQRNVVINLLDLSILRLVLWFVTPIVWFIWFDRVRSNVRILGGGDPSTSRLSAVYWWFVPIFSLWKPARAVGDVYGRLVVPGSPGAWLPAVWWLTWIGATVVPYIWSFPIFLVAVVRRTPIERVREVGNVIDLIGVGLTCVSGVLAIAMIVALQRAQAARSTTSVDPLPPAPWNAVGQTGGGAAAGATLSIIKPRKTSLPLVLVIVIGGLVAAAAVAGVVLAHSPG